MRKRLDEAQATTPAPPAPEPSTALYRWRGGIALVVAASPSSGLSELLEQLVADIRVVTVSPSSEWSLEGVGAVILGDADDAGAVGRNLPPSPGRTAPVIVFDPQITAAERQFVAPIGITVATTNEELLSALYRAGAIEEWTRPTLKAAPMA